MSTEYWGHTRWQHRTSDPLEDLAGMRRVLASNEIIVHCAEFHCTVEGGFSIVVSVPKLSDDFHADADAMKRRIEATWRGVPLDELSKVLAREWRERRAKWSAEPDARHPDSPAVAARRR